jgi:hypothetical protein
MEFSSLYTEGRPLVCLTSLINHLALVQDREGFRLSDRRYREVSSRIAHVIYPGPYQRKTGTGTTTGPYDLPCSIAMPIMLVRFRVSSHSFSHADFD